MNFLRADSSCGELALHVVERHRQLPELVGRVDGDRLPEVARRDLLGGELEALDALRQRARDQVAADQREQQRDPARDQDLVADGRDVRTMSDAGEEYTSTAADATVERDRIGGLGDRAGTRVLGAGAHPADVATAVLGDRERQRRASPPGGSSRPARRAAAARRHVG